MKERRDELTVLFEPLFKKVNSNGLTMQEFESLKDYPIAHKSLGEFIAANVYSGNFEWRNGRLFNTSRRNFLDLDICHENKLRLRAMEAGVSEEELIQGLVLDFLA